MPADAPLAEDAGDAGPAAVVDVMKRAADWQIAQLGTGQSISWVDAVFYAGLMAAYTTTGQARFLARATSWADANQWTIANPSDLSPGHMYLDGYRIDGVATHLASTQSTVDKTIASGQPGHLVWTIADALFGAPPVFARLGALTGKSPYFDVIGPMWRDVESVLYDPSAGLFFRDASYVKKTCPNGQKMFWSRGNGWVIAGVAEVLTYLPATHPDRPGFVTLLQTMAAKISPLQQADGSWPACLTDAADYPEPETSGTSAFVFAIAWGINEGILDPGQYLPVVRSGWRSLVSAVDGIGKLGWVQPVGSAPGPSTANDSAPYGVGLFLLAGCEVSKLADRL
jgi:rhamnogalacturonyl hydrolase YesR